MTDRLFKIKPLKWEKEETDEDEIRYAARNTFGSFFVFRVNDKEAYNYNSYYWGYCFDEYYDEGKFECNSIADGKKKAFKFWKSRLLNCLDKVTRKSHEL